MSALTTALAFSVHCTSRSADTDVQTSFFLEVDPHSQELSAQKALQAPEWVVMELEE